MEYNVKDAERKTRRAIKNPLSNDFKKYLAEILLNADDSYKRIENENDTSKKKIDIHLDRAKRVVTVIDRAEGMSENELREKFTLYGASHAGGHQYKVRGLFGQGASDVLFSSAMSKKKAEIKTIKDNDFQTCKFKFAKEKKVDIKTPRTHLKHIREKYGIEENGTVVIFGLPDAVRLPPKKTIKKTLETYYMFRYILSDERREIVLHDSHDTELSSKKYLFDKKNPLLEDEPVTFEYESYTIKGILNLYENKHKKHEHIHVIIKDERNAVYDNTLFGLKKYPGADIISGELELHDIYSILEAKLNDKEDPLQILTDSRDGFDRRNDFTKNMEKALSARIEAVIKERNQVREAKTVSLESQKRIRQALRKINDYYTERFASNIGALSPGMTPPKGGLAFAREAINITEGKKYGLHLFINADVMSDAEAIMLSAPGDACFSLNTTELFFNHDDADENGLIVKTLAVTGLQPEARSDKLQARQGDVTAETFVKVVEQEVIYPEFGLEFIPSNYTLKPGKQSKLKLYYDRTKYQPGTSVVITMTSKQELIAHEATYRIDDRYALDEQTGLIEVPFKSDFDSARYTITATVKELTTKARVKVERQKTRDKGKSGFINDIQIAFNDTFWQSSIKEEQAVFYINGLHSINLATLGNLGALDQKNPGFTQKQYLYIFELLAHELARRIVLKQWKDKEITDLEKMYDLVQEEKTNIYDRIVEGDD
jgi:hypothetical protein